MVALSLVLGLVLGLSGKASADQALTVDLGYSKYTGALGKTGITQWFGIRYAQAPVEDLRFRAPVAPLTDGQTYVANTHAPICRSSPSTSADSSHSEDCLFLDVYAPTASNGSHPVFVWFNGGGFNSMADANRDGSSLIAAAGYNMVVVTFNYRVGPYGFLASKEVVANGSLNNGLKDQRFVLEWIQKNIALFGGDPSQVTIGGASAGGASVTLQLTAYGGRDDKLFHAAAAESQSFGLQNTVEQSQYQYDALVTRLGCDTAADSLTCLRNVDTVTLADNNPDLPTPGGAGGYPLFMWGPTMDGDFCQNFTYNSFTNGKFVKVPTIFGDDTNEGTIFTPTSIATATNMHSFLKNNFPALTDADYATIDTYYPEGQQYTGKGAFWKTAANAYGDMRYTCAGIAVAGDLVLNGNAQSWLYKWDVLSAANNASGLGVTHTAEASSIWGTSSSPDSAFIPAIQAYWTSFIRAGNPNTYKLSTSAAWMPFDPTGKNRLYMGNGGGANTVAMQTISGQPESQRCAFFAGIGGRLQQ